MRFGTHIEVNAIFLRDAEGWFQMYQTLGGAIVQNNVYGGTVDSRPGASDPRPSLK